MTAPPEQQTWAGVVSGGGASGGQAGPGQAAPVLDRPPARERSLSQGEKRKQENQFQQRKPRKVAYGSSKVNIEEDGEAAPLDYYIGNTNPKASESIIEKVLIKCAAGLEGAPVLKVLEVKLLTKGENPRTKCWKITVPFKFKGIMEMDQLYHAGWTHRKFFNPRVSKQNNAKQPRVDDPIEQMAQEELEQSKQQPGQEQGAVGDERLTSDMVPDMEVGGSDTQ